MTKQVKITAGVLLCIVVLAILIGIYVGSIFDSKTEQIVAKKVDTSIADIKSEEFEVKKGCIYAKSFSMDSNDPFTESRIDTIKILELASSNKEPYKVYVKWTFTRWNDTTRYLSTPLEYLSRDIKEIK